VGGGEHLHFVLESSIPAGREKLNKSRSTGGVGITEELQLPLERICRNRSNEVIPSVRAVFVLVLNIHVKGAARLALDEFYSLGAPV
jgi:hypothetical protein